MANHMSSVKEKKDELLYGVKLTIPQMSDLFVVRSIVELS